MKLRSLVSAALLVAAALGLGTTVFADSAGPITFEPVAYSIGNINGQDGWKKTGPYDAAVADVATFPNAAGFGFGTQSLRLSNAVTSGSFGDQTISPGLTDAAGENAASNHFEASFDIGSTQAAQQPGLYLSVSPDDGNGSRMSYVAFDDQPDGIHVIFYDVTNAGPLPAVTTWNGTDVGTITRTQAHSIKFAIDFVPGPGNDVVKLYVDGSLAITGTTWEDSYRYDAEQNGNGNVLFSTSKLIFPLRGSAVPATVDAGYLVDNVSLSSSNPPTTIQDCQKGGWQDVSRVDGSTFSNQGSCIKYVGQQSDGPQNDGCPTILGGTILYSPSHFLAGEPLTVGYDIFGYNYQAHLFNGTYANVYLGSAGLPPYTGDTDAYLLENPGAAGHWAWPYRDVELSMKWNDAWIANTDCDDDGKLDRHYGFPSYIGSGAWETNHMSGDSLTASAWTDFVKIVAVPADAVKIDSIWFTADGVEIGPDIWGQFAIIQEVLNDPDSGTHGAQYISPAASGFGYYAAD